MSKKKIVAILNELFFILIFIAFGLYFKLNYSLNVSLDFSSFLCLYSILVGILILFGHRFNRYLAFVFNFIIGLYLIIQKIYYRAFHDYFRLNAAIGLLKELSDFKGAARDFYSWQDFLPLIFLLIITIILVILEIKLEKDLKYSLVQLGSILVIIISIFSYQTKLKEVYDSKDIQDEFLIFQSDYYIYDRISPVSTFVERFGLFSLGIRDCETFFIKEDYSNDIKELDEYFTSYKASDTDNDYTALLKGKNVIVVQAESLMQAVISEEFTPNLYYYRQSGINIKNFNTPLLFGSTSASEFMANTSLFAETDNLAPCYEYSNNEYHNDLASLFKDNGYKTLAFHSNYGNFYNRDSIFPNWGYDFYDCTDLGYDGLTGDYDASEKIGYLLADSKPFLGFWISYSMHQEYKYGDIGVNEDDVKLIREKYPDLDEMYVAYIAKAMDFDKALGEIINIMDWTNQLDDTVLIVYGDHYAKALPFEKGDSFDRSFNLNMQDNPEIQKTPCFIYARDIEHIEVDAYGTALDIVPTIANLMGFEYDHSATMGNDMLSGNSFCFDANDDIETADFYYNAASNEFTAKSDNYNSDKARQIIIDYQKKKDISLKLLRSDYYQIKKDIK